MAPFIGRLADLSRDSQERHAADFFSTPYTPASSNGTWRSGGKLGFGGDGIVGLWCQVDPHTDRIMDRVAVKQVMAGQATFEYPDHWVDGIVGGTPLEYDNGMCLYAQLIASVPRLEQYMARPLGFGAIDLNNYVYNLYSEYCPRGSLINVTRVQKATSTKYAGLKVSDPVPEAFIWYFLESMARVLVGMDAIGMLHRDLQAGNMLFGDPDPHNFAMYPTPKMADFGSAGFHADLEDKNMDRGEAGEEYGCCQPYAPPESKFAPRMHKDDDWEWAVDDQVETDIGWLTRKTDVWQIGMLALCLIRNQAPIQECDRGHIDAKDSSTRLNFNSDPGQGKRSVSSRDYLSLGTRATAASTLSHPTYSDDLCDLVDSMIQFQPRDRPRPSILLRKIRATLEDKPQLLAGMREKRPSGDVASIPKDKYFLHIMRGPNEYRLGALLEEETLEESDV
jgi:serine/threonine protein kinase